MIFIYVLECLVIFLLQNEKGDEDFVCNSYIILYDPNGMIDYQSSYFIML